MKSALVVVLAFCAGLAAKPALAEACDKLTAARLNGDTQEELERLDVAADDSAEAHAQIVAMKERFAEASALHTQAIDRSNKDDLQAACDAYRSLFDEAKQMAE